MKTIFFVKPEEAELARAMEKCLLDIPEASGFLFVGVDTELRPYCTDNRAAYTVVVGCSRETEPSLVETVVRHYLKDMVDLQLLTIKAYRGFVRS